MTQDFYKGRTNNHLTWVMVDATDFASPESALSAATKIKIYGKLRGATGVNFVSSGTGSLTNDIQHVGASVLGIYTIALAKADLSDASAAWYDQYIISLSATGAAFQTLIVNGGINESGISDMLSYLSGIASDLNSRITKAVATNSQLSDLHSDLRSYLLVMSGVLSDAYSGIVALSDAVSNAYSAAVVGTSRVLLVQSRLSDLDSRLVSDVSDLMSQLLLGVSAASDAASAAQQTNSRVLLIQSRLSGLDSRLVSDVSDLLSAVRGNSDALSDLLSRLNSASFLSDIASHVWAAKYTANSAASSFGSLMSDIFSRAGGAVTASDISDIASAVWAAALATKLVQLNTSDLSDLRSAIAAGPAATITASDISDIASAVWATALATKLVQLNTSDLSDLRSAITAGAAGTVTASDISDIASAVADALASRLSDILSGVVLNQLGILLAQSAASDAASGVTVLLSRVPKAVATNSQLSDLHSDLRSVLLVMSGVLSDIASGVVALSDAVSNAYSAAVAGGTPSDVASKVWAEKYTAASNVKASTFGSAVRLSLSRVSDIQSALSDFQSDFGSRVPKRVATDSQLSDLHSDLKSYMAGLSAVLNDTYSGLSDFQSDFGSRVPKRVATDSQLSDLHSDLRSMLLVAQSQASDTGSLLAEVDDALRNKQHFLKSTGKLRTYKDDDATVLYSNIVTSDATSVVRTK